MTKGKPRADGPQFRDILEEARLGVIFQDREGRIIEANAAAREILGLTSDEMMGRTSTDPRWRALREDGSPFPGDEHPAMVALRTGKRVRNVVMGVLDPRRDETRWIRITAVPECNEGETEPCRVYAIFSDITDLRRSMEAVAASEEKFRSVVQASPMGVLLYRLEPDGRLIFTAANPAADEILGVDTRRFVGKTIEEAFPPLADTEVPERYRDVCRTGKPWGTEQIDYADEIIRGAYEVHAFRTDPDNMAVMFLDITERKKVEEALHASELRHRALFESAGDAILLMRDLRFIDCNPVAVKLFGRPREEILGRTPMDFSPPTQPDGQDSRERAEQLLAQVAAGEVTTFDWRHALADGTLFDAEVTLTGIEIAGEQLFLAHVRDITEQRRLEERLAQAQRMETVGQLAGGVAHDFNNLLTPILGYAELLLQEIDPGDPRHAEVDEIRKAAERARTLIRQLLAFSRKQVLEMKVVDLGEVVTDFRKMLRRTIREDIEIRLRTSPELDPVCADVHQIGQVLMNLALNARDAMNGPGTLTIEITNAEPTPELARSQADVAPGRYVMLAVSDSGAGMDEATLQRVFEPFFTTKEKSKGTGLGLATVYGIVKQHRGFVTARSRPGEGSRFEVYLPRAERLAGAVDTATGRVEKPTGSETVVVVEDDDTVRGLACRILRKHGYNVLEARSAQECIAVFEQRRQPVDLLLADVVMPEMNGRKLYETLAKTRPGLRVLYMSGYTDDVIASHGVLDDGVELIQKPFSANDLARRVRDVLT
jgi:PAS domain S-box-containing protein